MTSQFKTVLTHFSKALPPLRVTNDDLSAFMDTNDAWIRERTGICERRFADKSVSTSDLALEAVAAVLQASGYAPRDFDYIMASTLSPDYYFPGIAPLIQHRLRFPHIPALDIRVQCSAFVYSVQMADALIRSGAYKRILLVFSDVQSKILDLTTAGRNTAVLFGDGAAAVICEAVSCSERPTLKNGHPGVLDSVLGADGSGAALLCSKAPGTAHPHFLDESVLQSGDWHPKMEGRAVFKHAVTRMCEVAQSLLERNGVTLADIDYLIPHQANLRISECVREKIGLPPEKVFNNVQQYGNTTSATIPICFAEALACGALKPGSLVMTVAFGAGFTWGGNLIRV